MSDIKSIYNNIASDFSRTRYQVWPCVSNFLDTFYKNSKILDIGCGNGKNMKYRDDLIMKGIDISVEFVKICQTKKLDVIESDMTDIKLEDNYFDGIIAIASYHHLDNDVARTKSLNEMYRLLKTGGLCFITVWAMEQEEGSKFNFTKSDELVKWVERSTKQVYYRYYHIYENNDLIIEITRLKPEFKVIKYGWEKGNWFIILQK
jgi:alkylated DNA repair protein alkB family protein 8